MLRPELLVKVVLTRNKLTTEALRKKATDRPQKSKGGEKTNVVSKRQKTKQIRKQ